MPQRKYRCSSNADNTGGERINRAQCGRREEAREENEGEGRQERDQKVSAQVPSSGAVEVVPQLDGCSFRSQAARIVGVAGGVEKLSVMQRPKRACTNVEC